MKYFLCNLTWGRGSVGDEAILAGLLTKYDKNDVIVGSYDAEETHNIFGIKTVDENAVVNADILVIGGGYLLSSSSAGLHDLVNKYQKRGCKIEIRAVGCSPTNPDTLELLKKADYVSVRQKSLATQLAIDYERDFAYYCPMEKWDHNYHGWVGLNALSVCGAGTLKESVDIELPENERILGIASVRHKMDSNEDDFIALKEKNCDDYFHTCNPMKMKYLLSTLKCMYSQRKHLSLLSHLAGTPTYYYGKHEDNRSLVEEWGVPVI